jgi:hypothetical protein
MTQEFEKDGDPDAYMESLLTLAKAHSGPGTDGKIVAVGELGLGM